MNKKKLQQRHQQAQFVSASFSGPLPPPNILAAYNNIQPGLADRIVKMAELQSEHRQEQESKVVDAGIFMEKAGVATSFLVTLALVGFGAYLVSIGRDAAGYISAFVPIIFQGGSVLYTKYKNKEK